MKLIEWFRTLKRIVHCYDSEMKAMHLFADKVSLTAEKAERRSMLAEEIIRERTNIGVDVHFKQANHVIIIGKYNGVDYVNSFTLPEGDLNLLVKQLQGMEKHANIKRIDTPPQFRASFRREMDRF